MSSDDDQVERGRSERSEEDDDAETEAAAVKEAETAANTGESAADSDGDGEDETGDRLDEDDSGHTDSHGDADETPSAFDDEELRQGDDSGSPFDESFSDAFNRAPDGPADEMGTGELDAEGAFSAPGEGDRDGDGDGLGTFSDELPDFSDETLDSDLDRLKIGVDGLDEMILGGIPHRSLIVSIGSAGTGKTTLAMQFLNTALEAGDRAVYITLEESRIRVLNTAEEKGWAFRRYEEEGTLAIVDLDPVEMANSLASIRNDLTRLINEFGAERLVLDSVSLLEMMYDHPARRRSEVFGFTRALKEAGVTTLVTSESNENDPFASRYGIIEYLADAVFVLKYVRSSSFQETRLAIEIQKIRDANHSRQPKPYDITNEGIDVHQQANLF